MSTTDKMAAKDAARWAYAEMFFGDGAGTRRRLLVAEIDDKVMKIPGYAEAFDKNYAKQDFAKHAAKATKERKLLDRKAKVGRNTRGILTGNRRSLTGTVLLGVTVYGFLHQTGLDEPIKAEVKKRYYIVKREIDGWRERRKDAKVYNISNVYTSEADVDGTDNA